MDRLVIGNKTISKPLLDIILDIKSQLRTGKLQSVVPKGDNIRVTCPHHKNGLEKKPAADIYIGDHTDTVEYGWYHCFVCNENGPFYHFVAECFDKTDDWAKAWLIENYADGILTYTEDVLPPITFTKSNRKEYLDESILNTFDDFHPYMLQRKLSREICKKFEVKYDRDSKCLVFAVRDEKGKLVMLTRRSVEDKRFIIDANKEKPVYLLYNLLKNNIQEAYVVESQINCLTLLTHGLPAIALFGTGSSHQYDILNKSNIRVYNLMFDGDEAGDKGITKFLQNIRKDVIVNIIRLPRGKDVNDLSYDEVENLISHTLENNCIK